MTIRLTGLKLISSNTAPIQAGLLGTLMNTDKHIAAHEHELVRLLKSNRIAQAEEILINCGGALYPFNHGYDSLARIVEAAPEEAHLTSEAFLGALCFLLAKQGRARRARTLLRDTQIQFEKRYLLDLFELLIVIHLGEDLTEVQVTIWSRLESHIPVDQPLYEGLYYNSMLVIMVRLNRLGHARTMAALAIESFTRARSPLLVHYIHLHLADLAIVEGDLNNARRHVKLAETFLQESGVNDSTELQLIDIVWLSLDFERGKLERIPERSRSIRKALENGDSWAEIFIQVCRIGTVATYFMEGRAAAVAFLDECQIGYYRVHGESSNSLDVILAHINLLEGRLEQAQQLLHSAKAQGLFSALGSVMFDIVQAKIDPLSVSDHSEFDSSNLRREIVCELVKASACKNQKRPAAMRHHVESAMRLAVQQGLVTIFLEHREVVIKVSGKLATGAFARGHVQLARLAKHVHKLVHASYVMPVFLSKLGVTNQQMRVLNALQYGSTNKQIARNLGVSEATVKYHLHNLFDAFKVSKRGQLIEYISNFA